jgi:hypothetical protein
MKHFFMLLISMFLMGSCSESKFVSGSGTNFHGADGGKTGDSGKNPGGDMDAHRDQKEIFGGGDNPGTFGGGDLGDDDGKVDVPGTPARIVGVGFAAGNHDDWNDGAICFEATENDITVNKKDIVANKNVKIKLKLFADMLPNPQLTVTKTTKDGKSEVLVTRQMDRGSRHEVEVELKGGDKLFSKLEANGQMFDQSMTEWSRVTIGQCDDYLDR